MIPVGINKGALGYKMYEDNMMNKEINCAELVDTMNHRLAIGFLVVSLAYAFDVLTFLVNEPIKYYADRAGTVMAVLAVVIILYALRPVLNQRISKTQTKAHETESFITEALNTSIRTSWILALVSITVMMAMNKFGVNLDLPVDFYFRLLFFIMMFSVALSFMIRTRDAGSAELT